MKKFLLFFILSVFTIVLILLGILFFKPSLIINPKNLAWALSKQSIVTKWSWGDAVIAIDWKKWNDRHIYGHFHNLCLKVETETMELDGCLEEISWDFQLINLSVHTNKALLINSKNLIAKIKETETKVEEEKDFEQIDIYSYWKMLWYPIIPDLAFSFENIEIHTTSKFEFDLKILKDKNELKIESLDFSLIANKDSFIIAPPKKYPLPIDAVLGHKLYLYNFELKGDISEESLAFKLDGRFEVIDIDLSANLSLPIKDDPMLGKLRKDFLKTLSAKLSVKEINKKFDKYSNEEFPALPAPLNVMEGYFITEIGARDEGRDDEIVFDIVSELDIKSEDQALNLVLDMDVPINVVSFSPGSIVVDVGFNKVQLKLPRLSKTSLPPQFMPDARIGKGTVQKESKESEPIDLNIKLEALNDKALHLNTNLLDEPLRLNFDINIVKGEMDKGFVKVLPLKTSVFRRPIHLEFATISFNPPLLPVIEAKILFPLPIYKVTLDLEGPTSGPRFAFTSEPPLPQNDIFAVLLFGRPLTDLSPDDKNAAQRTNQILSQGIFSLSVLYFLAGSPVEYIGYDAESKNATASIGIDSKTSLRVEGGGQGVNSTGVRRSLGKGWYIDTSVEKTTTTTTEEAQSYGVMLERIIAY